MSLGDRVEVRRSGIHGRGCFARKRLRRFAHIGTFEGVRTKENGTYVLWVVGDDGRDVGIRGRNELRYVNHSRDANAEFDGAELYAVRNIQPGHEITLDYGETWDDVDED